MVLGWSCLPFGPNRARGSTHFHRHSHTLFATKPYPRSYSSCHLIFVFSQFLFLVPFGMALKAVGAHGVLTCSVVRSMRLFAYGLGFLFVLLLFGSSSWGSRLGSASSSRRAVVFLVRGMLGCGTELLCGPNIGSSAIWYLIFSTSGS